MNKKITSITEKIVLGTAQFGIDYGITNLFGKPTKKEVFKILSLAWERGIRYFDTAPGYDSEKILGDFISVNGVKKDAKILTKIPALNLSSNYSQVIKSSIESSLKNLGCPIEVIFFHNAGDSDLLLSDPKYFEKLLKEYSISTLGVSVYETAEVEKLSDVKFELAYQFPYNVLDKRFEKIKWMKGKLYARSIFLQGLLASKNGLKQDAPKELLDLQNYYHTLLARNNIEPIKYAISSVLNKKYVDYFLFGVETENQLNEILDLKLYNQQQMNILEPFRFNIDKKWLDPRAWN